MHLKDEISRSKTQSLSKKKFYRGELEMLHGKQEAAIFIRTGKFKRAVDEAGDEVFVKVTESEVVEKQRKQTISASRTALV